MAAKSRPRSCGNRSRLRCVRQVDGTNLHYKDYGPKGPGVPAVLLLHGFNGSTFSWCARWFIITWVKEPGLFGRAAVPCMSAALYVARA